MTKYADTQKNPPHKGGLGGSGAPLISPPICHFIGGSESVKILGVQGILIMWELVFARVTLDSQQEEEQAKNSA